jgi:hypothetical protein
MIQHPEKKLDVPLSVLDLIMANADDGFPGQYMQNGLDLTQHADLGDTNSIGWPSITTPKA